MARTAKFTDPAIGARIRTRRLLRPGLSVRRAAELAGVDHTTWSRYENGRISADNRVTLGKIAAVLGCTRADLVGEPEEPTTARQAENAGGVRDTLVAFIGADLRLPAPIGPAADLRALGRELELIRDLRQSCRYDAAAFRLPDLVRGLHVATGGQYREAALRQLVIAADTASFVVRYAGNTAGACLIAERAQQAAQALGDPVMLALAAWSNAHAMTGCGLYAQARAIGAAAATDLQPHLDVPDALPMYGQLLMIQAFALFAMGDTDGAADAVTEAKAVAQRTGDTTDLRLMFGPTNIAFWEVSMHADGGDPDRAVAIGNTTNPRLVDSVSRQFAFWSDLARAVTHAYPKGGHDAEAMRMLATAERLAPQRMHSPLVRETVRGLLERAGRRHLGPLRAMCERIGAAG